MHILQLKWSRCSHVLLKCWKCYLNIFSGGRMFWRNLFGKPSPKITQVFPFHPTNQHLHQYPKSTPKFWKKTLPFTTAKAKSTGTRCFSWWWSLLVRMACGCYRPFCRWWVAPNTLLSWELPDFSGVVSGFFVCFKQNAEMRRLWCFSRFCLLLLGFLKTSLKTPWFLQRWESKTTCFFLQRNTCDLKPELFLKQMFVGTQIIGLSILQGVFSLR